MGGVRRKYRGSVLKVADRNCCADSEPLLNTVAVAWLCGGAASPRAGQEGVSKSRPQDISKNLPSLLKSTASPEAINNFYLYLLRI